jgi:ATP-dependent DNA helicase RecG
MTHRLDDSCRFLKGVGPRRAEALERLDVRTVEDLLLHLPRTYYDRSHVVPLCALRPGVVACARARIESLHARPAWRGRSTVVATVADDTGRLRVVWFNAWVRDVLRPGHEVVLAGPVVENRGRLEMHQPEFELVETEAQELVHAGRIVPLYPLTRGVSQKWMRALLRRALETHAQLACEVLPAAVRGDRPERSEALRAVHFPANQAQADLARERLKFEELFFFQLLLARRNCAKSLVRGPVLRRERSLQDRYLETLPFQLTKAQRRVLDEIGSDLESGRWMQRLVQGDVGSGKTVVAAAALFCAAGNGWQGAFMAPTESLAVQHAERLAPACARLGVRFDLLIGSRTERDKELLRARLRSGDVDLVVGTHALIQEGVEWARLGLAVVDEQQRFGVLQRGALQRGEETRPHVLVLTATPIPRSLALTLFGDLDVSRLDEKPPGREPVSTHLVPPQRRRELYEFVRRELEAGRQAYVVLPLIDASDKLELRAATEEYDSLRAGPLAGLRLGLLHGRLPAAEKQALLAAFRRGEVQCLVSTTVVEVGIDVAGASLMLVHHPERFGLSQLHQLRGRVGRSVGLASYCFLLLDAAASPETQARLREFAATEDGFRIAELDLRARGPGDFVGTRQHGLPTLRVADPVLDAELLDAARLAAFEIVRQDPGLERPEHAAMRAHLESRFHEQESLAEIG